MKKIQEVLVFNKYIWKNWQTADFLSQIFGVTKRRILQVIQALKKEGKVISAVIVFVDVQHENIGSSRVYMRTDIPNYLMKGD
jgi:hypothetical protein